MKMNGMKKKLLSLLMALTMCLTLAACGEEEVSGDVSEDTQSNVPEVSVPETNIEPESDAPESDEPVADTSAVPGSWAVYWYLCGSDLESKNGFASIDLNEMMAVQLP